MRFFGSHQGGATINPPLAASSLISDYALNETSTPLVDSINGVNATVVGSPTWSLATMETTGTGHSIYFTGGAYATLPASNAHHDLTALTISIYYQRNSSAAKQTLIAVGAGAVTQIGDLALEVLATGVLRGFHVGQDGVLRFFESTDGITGTNLVVGTAYRIDLSFGSLGARIYLNGSLLTSIAGNTNGWDNSSVKYLGVWVDGVQSPIDGAIARLRIWQQQLSNAEIAALNPPQSITLPGQTSDVAVVPLSAFTRSTVDVTALAGWPTGRTPNRISSQANHASGYIRRYWKATLNNGHYIDFMPGWQKTTSTEYIGLVLDNGNPLNIPITVGHAIPSPTGSGVTRTLDKTATPAGTTYNTWASAVAALTTGDVLLVRAPTGTWADPAGHPIPNYVYDVTTNPAPAAAINNVTILAHPDDVAAGRRPVIFRNAGKFARYKYDPTNSWEVKTSLAGNMFVYRTKETQTAPAFSYFGAYRDRKGAWICMYSMQLLSDPDRSAVMADVTYPRQAYLAISTYIGPAILYNSGTSRYEVRLDAPAKRTYMDPASAAPFPPWDWSDHYPPSTNPGSCEIIITDGNHLKGTVLLTISSRTGWKFYNLDFVYGDCGIDAGESQAGQPQFYGCTFVGGPPTYWNNAGGQTLSSMSSAINNSTMSTNPSTDLLIDRCSLHGASPPWIDFAELKGFTGAPGLSTRREFCSGTRGSLVIRYSHLRSWNNFTWNGGVPGINKAHFHHNRLCEVGIVDGALLFQMPTTTNYHVSRNFLGGVALWGVVSYQGSGTYWECFNVRVGLLTLGAGYPNTDKYVYTDHGVAVPCWSPPQSINHGGGMYVTERRFHNTCVGSQDTFPHEASAGGSGCGSGIGTDTYSSSGGNRIVNNIGAVYPSPFAWQPVGRGNTVGVYSRRGGGHEYDYNVLYRDPGMLAPGTGPNGFFFASDGAGTTAGTTYATLAAMQAAPPTGEGWEVHSISANPQFVVAPVWATSSPYAVGGAFDMANYMLAAGSPALSGGENLNGQGNADYDFELLTTYLGFASPFRGALDPNIPYIEQEVGIVGPMPPELS